MNTVAKDEPKNAVKKFKSGKKPFNKNFQKKKIEDNRPPLAFLVLDLANYATNAKIIRIFQLVVYQDGETEASTHLFNNGGQEISEESTKYHGLTADQLQDKPDVSSFNFCLAKNVVVWDGQVTRSIFRKNNISKFSPIINLHSLARHLEPTQKSMKLDHYALRANPAKKHIMEFKLKKIENKVLALHDIYEHICSRYKEKYDENRPAFLVALGKTSNKVKFTEAIEAYMKKRNEIESRKKHKAPKEQVEPKTENKVITVNTSAKQAKEGVKTVVIIKRNKT